MDTYSHEQEQIEIIKTWLKQYAPSILLGIFLAIAGNFAWRYWTVHQNRVLEIASLSFEQLLNSSQEDDFAAVRLRADRIFQDYAKTPYASMAALTLAQQAVAHHDVAFADEKLQWVITHSHLAWLKQIARLHRAQILLEQGKADEAWQVLQVVEDKTFMPLIEQMRGQSKLATNDITAAREHLQLAQKQLPPESMLATLLKMQLDDLNATS